MVHMGAHRALHNDFAKVSDSVRAKIMYIMYGFDVQSIAFGSLQINVLGQGLVS